MENCWAVVKTRPNCEKIATANLLNQGFQYYLPMIVDRKVRFKRSVTVESPLFPNYLFVHVQNMWRPILGTRGVSSIVGKVPDAIINDLRSREVNGFVQLPKPRKFDVGDTVKILSGPFAMQKGLVERMNSKERQKVLLALLSNQIRILVEESDLEAA